MLNIRSNLVLLLVFVGIATACDTKWPNNTDTTFHWWQCNNGPMKFFNATPYDASGKNYEYPIHLGAPLMVKTEAYLPHSYKSPNLLNTINLYSWGVSSCTWSSLPTFGLLKNLDACTNGITCPVPAGSQELDVILDFTKFEAIISMLKDDSPYQLQFMLHDKLTGDDGCVLAQARARLH